MKLLLSYPKRSLFRIVLLLTLSLIVVSEISCTPKPGCGNKRDHRVRKRRVHKFAPTMGYIYDAKKNVKFIS